MHVRLISEETRLYVWLIAKVATFPTELSIQNPLSQTLVDSDGPRNFLADV